MSLYLIAECGLNANGSVDLAKQMILAAHEAGFDAVKFQKRTIDKVYTKEFLEGPRESPWGTTQRAQKEGLEFSRAQYEEINAYCKELGISWSASAWDLESQDFIRSFDVPWNKIASAMLGHKPLLRKVAAEQKPTFISTGMATLEEIDEVVELFRRADCPFILMHCNSTYPMRDEDANLWMIPRLRERYNNCDIGYSGHETSVTKVCVAAVALGAMAIERHITLDKTMYGSDQAASIETHDLKNFVEVIRAVPFIMVKTMEKEILDTEWPVRKKLRVEVP